MRIVVYYHPSSSFSNRWLSAFCDGLRRHGVGHERRPFDEAAPCDLAVVYAHGTRQRAIGEAMRASGRHYLVMEMGYVGDREVWQSLRFDGLNGRGWCPPAPDGGDRFRLHHADLLPWRHGGEYVLLLGQHRGDQATAHVRLGAWYETAASFLATTAGLPVLFRPHPDTPNDRGGTGLPVLRSTLEEALERAAIAVTLNSNAGVVAALSGVPTIATDPGSMAWPVAGHDFGEVVRPEREDWCADLAWSQWRIEEIECGDAWAFLGAAI